MLVPLHTINFFEKNGIIKEEVIRFDALMAITESYQTIKEEVIRFDDT